MIAKRDLINFSIVLLLLALVFLTLTPLFLMYHTSLKPLGTLRKQVRQITLDIKKGSPGTWNSRVNQDLRKFSSLTIIAKGVSGGEQFEISFTDINGATCALDSVKYITTGLSGDYQEIVIPVDDFDIKTLNYGLPEDIAETIIIRSKDNKDNVLIDKVVLVAKKVTLVNYVDVLVSSHFARYFMNSALIAIIITVGNIFFCTLVGYAFARKDFAFKNFLFILILASIMIPPQIFIVPIFILMKNIGWLNTYLALIVPSLAQPFGIFLMKQYISRLPVSMEDQARVDGASETQILFKIIFPLSIPALAIVGINTFMGAWNTFLFPFILTNTPHMRTLPVGLALFKNLQGADWVHIMAGSGLTALPVIIVFLGFQKYIIAGLQTGLVKR